MKKLLVSLILSFFASYSFAQVANRPTDYLLPVFHKERRQALRDKMPENSVAVFFSNPVRNRANDVQYMYHQDPDFHYLTGHREPHAVLLIFKEPQNIDGVSTNETIFVRAHDSLKELYDGARMGKEGAIEQLLLAQAFEGSDFETFNLNFSAFDKVMFYDFFDDVRDTNEKGDLYDLIKQFKQKVGFTSNNLSIEPKSNNIDLVTLNQIMTKLRGIKEKEELILLRKAINISTIGQLEVMKAMHPGMSEAEIQGMHEYIYKKYQAEFEGYPSIVGAGHNGCVLHYIDNYKPKIEDGEMILMDLGAEYHGYTADVTRTIPVNGKFSPEQKKIYDIVYEAQEAAMGIAKSGTKFSELNQVIDRIIIESLANLGIYKSVNNEDVINPDTGRKRYNPHGCCHHIGLDVHDKGEYNVLEENMVITIEPGIYIPEGSPCDKKWWNIAVRIEDDYLITKDGYELLSNLAPRTTEEIEKLMAEPSPFDKVVLPILD